MSFSCAVQNERGSVVQKIEYVQSLILDAKRLHDDKGHSMYFGLLIFLMLLLQVIQLICILIEIYILREINNTSYCLTDISYPLQQSVRRSISTLSANVSALTIVFAFHVLMLS